MSLRSPLSQVQGLGSAKEGVNHWWWQRVTALALVPLTVWLVICVARLTGADHAEVAAWMRSPLNSALLILFVSVGLYHTQLGMQVVWEDYVQSEWFKFATIIGTKFIATLLAVIAFISILRIALGS
ncbi:MAG: succinate dehydrogenase, hydrophobic membrane anchor protein [Gammaproteobacteria bacterium]|nr:succinate dehydrogenase, hydrophobic membrane anchor protein [Gammaproteobacteria bacterium]